jgi:malate dehydrogenase (oxaloacetate-decarboxylating)(NADP+)
LISSIPRDDPRHRSYGRLISIWLEGGVTPEAGRTVVRTNNTVIALAVVRGEADAMICGGGGR